MNRRKTLSSKLVQMPKFTRNMMAMNMDCLGMSASDWTCIDMLGIASCLQKLSKPLDYIIGKPGGSLVSLSWLHCDADLTIRPSIGLVSQCHLRQKIRGCIKCLLSHLNASIALYVIWIYLIYQTIDQEPRVYVSLSFSLSGQRTLVLWIKKLVGTGDLSYVGLMPSIRPE